MIVALGAGFCFQLIQDMLETAKRISARVIPLGVKHHGPGKYLRGRERAAAPMYWLHILGEPRSSVERLSEDHWPVPSPDGFKSHL